MRDLSLRAAVGGEAISLFYPEIALRNTPSEAKEQAQ